MAKITLDPEEFQGQVDSFTSNTEAIAEMKYTIEPDGVMLQSIEKYKECVTAINELIKQFTDFAAMDGESLKQIKAKWMHADSELATKTIREIITDCIFGESE